MFKISYVTAIILAMVTSPALANGYKPVVPVKDLNGWQCMALASSYGPNGVNAPAAPVYQSATLDSPQVGTAAGVIITKDPENIANGRVQILQSSGREVWIKADLLTKWHVLSDPNAQCVPALLSNGRHGFRTVD